MTLCFGLPRKKKIVVKKFGLKSMNLERNAGNFWTWIVAVIFFAGGGGGGVKRWRNKTDKFAGRIR